MDVFWLAQADTDEFTADDEAADGNGKDRQKDGASPAQPPAETVRPATVGGERRAEEAEWGWRETAAGAEQHH